MSLPHRHHALQPYYDIIKAALNSRSASKGDFNRDQEHGVPVFVSRMCKQLAEVCVERGQRATTIKDVLRLDMLASGHSDYHTKLALYCRELEQSGPNRPKQ
tara:strand:- start:2728 stop:3033 length:306 start_codon:yes stop_codon:yes gene_type:complete